MRVTDLTKRNAVQDNIQKNSESLQNLMVNVSSGKRIQKPSDDPIGAMTSQDYQTSINRAGSITRNISANKVWLEKSEQIIAEVGDILQRTKELTLEAADGSATREGRTLIGGEVEAILNNLIKIGNTKEGKLFFFSGTKTFTRPFQKNPDRIPANLIYKRHDLKSSTEVIPAKQDEPLGVRTGVLEINIVRDKVITDLDGNEKKVEEKTPVQIQLDEKDSIKVIIEKINDAFIEAKKFKPSEDYPFGYVSDLSAQMDIDHKLRLLPDEGVRIEKGQDTTGFWALMDFDAKPMNTTSSKVKAHFRGHADKNYILRIVKDGKLGKAQYTVSDDNGDSWGRTEYLKNHNELYNPEGEASRKVDLVFEGANNYDFKEGQEFRFSGNPTVRYYGNDQSREVLIDSGITLPLNIPGRDLFFNTIDDTVNVFDVLHAIKENAVADDQGNLLKIIGDIDKAIKQVLLIRSEIGTRVKSLEDSNARLDTAVYSKTKSLSDLTDLDVSKAMIDLNQEELKNKASLDTGARLIQPTLLNFLR